MKLSDFDFELPQELIAQHPPLARGHSRLLDASQFPQLFDRIFSNVSDLVKPGDCLVLNDTKVIKARLKGTKQSGGQLEILFERMLDPQHFTAMIRASHAPKPGSRIVLPNDTPATVLEKNGMMYTLGIEDPEVNLFDLLENFGELPLPPYIAHTANQEDDTRYQTVFARHQGAVAAPTAGLHFTQALLEQLSARGAKLLNVTLHVGAGTFLPVKTDNVAEHVMHKERFEIQPEVIDSLIECKAAGGRIVCVGTTSLRALEAWATESQCTLKTSNGLKLARQQNKCVYQGDTDIFITPGYEFKVADCLITNFHLPKSTLLMLVSAFAGQAAIRSIYSHAIEQRYRFFSYGDAMWLALNNPSANQSD